ncbi:MAG: ATP-binding cassette domain-containing protein [Anaerotignum sp.]|nr:ATP-binding cassette domain-containing protein [Anaerotignum sp.]
MVLSGGQKQRLAVGISIFEKKKYIIFDEPTSGLDYQHMVSVAKRIRELQKYTKLIFVITHDYEFLNLCCDGYIELKDGSLAYT